MVQFGRMNLKELSEHLKLSQTTVSRALNGYPEVRETTRRRVLDAAREFNYSPNARAKGLATGRAMSIGHVIPVSAKHGFSTRFSAISSPARPKPMSRRVTSWC